MDRTKRDEYVEYVRARMPRLHRTAFEHLGVAAFPKGKRA